MHSHKPDTFVLVTAAMSEKMVEQATRIFDLESHLALQSEQMYADQRTISDLRSQVSEMHNLRECNERQSRTISDLSYKHAAQVNNLKQENEQLYDEVRQLRIEKARRDLCISLQATPEEAAIAYMQMYGVDMWNKPSTPDVAGGKIECLKVVRSLTGWDLRPAKDFVEAYMARYEEGKEETPSGTKRSSQIPTGVGVSAKKSSPLTFGMIAEAIG